jgi:hypothetical protein
VRTTLSIDDDVASLIKKEMRRSGAPLKTVVNRLLRLGLMASKQQGRKSFVVTPRKLGLPPGLSYDDVEELLEATEGATHK